VFRRLAVLALVLSTSVWAGAAAAIPALQIYIDGATYDTQSQTWVTTNNDFDLWVVGDVSQSGSIYEVKLAVSFFGLGGGVFTLTPATTSRVTDPSLPAAPVLLGSGTGNHPVLPVHGIFGDPTLHHWENYVLGDFSAQDSPVANFNGSETFPTSFPDHGQVNVYHVHVEGWNKVHFDAYDHTVDSMNGKETFWKTPGSHDGELPLQPTSWGAVKSLYGR